MAFTQKEKDVIIWGKSNGKSQQEVEQALVRLRTGTPTNTLAKKVEETPEESEGFIKDTVDDFTQIGKDILKGSQKRTDKIADIRKKMESGEKGDVTAILEGAGQLAGAGADAIGAVVKGAFKMVLPPRVEKQAKEVVQKLGTEVIKQPKVQEVIKWYEELPDEDKDAVDAIGGVVSLASEFVGLGAGKRAATAVKEGVEEGVEAGFKATKNAAKTAMEGTEEGLKVAKSAVRDVIPTAERVVNTTIAKALYLAPSDIKNISMSTGNEVGEFIAKHNLIGANTDETVKLIDDFFSKNYAQVREEIAKVGVNYPVAKVPRYQEALKELKKAVGDVPGMEKIDAEVDILLGNKKPTLEDVQRVKELLDEHFSLYKVTGDVKESVQKEGLANMRKDLRKFIEDEVKANTGIDIADLNNKVSTSKSIMNAIEVRAPKGITKANLQMGDLGAFGIGSVFGGPLGGLAALALKKISQSPAVMLRFARFMDKLSDARKAKIIEAMKAGEVPVEIEELINKP